jgi:biotin transport system permease protein
MADQFTKFLDELSRVLGHPVQASGPDRLSVVLDGAQRLEVDFGDPVTITTPLQALLAAIEPLLRPLQLLGLSSERLAFGMGLLIRMASLQRGTWQQLRQAYQVRGVQRPGLRLIAPSLRAGLRQADHMARALSARQPAAGQAHSQGRPRQE